MKISIFYILVLIAIFSTGCGINKVVDSFEVCYQDDERGLNICGELGLNNQQTKEEQNIVLNHQKSDGKVQTLYTFTEEEVKTLYKEAGIREKLMSSQKSAYSGIKKFCKTGQFTGLSTAQVSFLRAKNVSAYRYLKKISSKK